MWRCHEPISQTSYEETTMAMDNRKGSMLKPVSDLAEDASRRVSDSIESVRNDASDLKQSLSRGAQDVAENVSGRLKQAGVDTEVMLEAAKGKAANLQDMLAEELRRHPLRSIGIAAAVGLVFGLISAR
jgi:ElaB/YqjD/DUF883 family membrane-anchored ribosome-binding protein